MEDGHPVADAMTTSPVPEGDAAIAVPLSPNELCPDDLLAGQEAAFARDIARLRTYAETFVDVPCPACGGTAIDPAFEKFEFSYATCRNCGTIFMTPRPPAEVMADYYANSENYRYWATYIYPSSEATRREKLHRPRLERILGYCERFSVPRGLLVEVGAGFGTFAALAGQSGRFARILAIEPTPDVAAACRARGIEVIERRIEEVAAEEVNADVVVSFEVIEHLFAPTEFVAQARRLLKPGGLLVLTCPNGQGFDIAMLGPHSLAVDPQHVNLFNPDSLPRLLERHGFQTLDVSTPGRLDAEYAREAALQGRLDLSGDPFLRRVLVDEWDRLGWPFQQFLAANRLSAHMWLVARRVG